MRPPAEPLIPLPNTGGLSRTSSAIIFEESQAALLKAQQMEAAEAASKAAVAPRITTRPAAAAREWSWPAPQPSAHSATPYGRSLEDLGEGLLHAIVARANLSIHEFCRNMCVSKAFYAACRSAEAWRSVEIDGKDLKHCKVSSRALQQVAGHCRKLQALTLSNINSAKHFPDAKEAEEGQLDDGVEAMLRAAGPSLQRLTVLWLAARHCSHLEDFAYILNGHDVTDAAMWALTCSCPHLTRFQCFIGVSSVPSDESLRLMGRGWSKLRQLRVDARDITTDGLLALRDCSQLQSLDLVRCQPSLFLRSKLDRGGSILFQSLREVMFTFALPTADDLRTLVEMCPLLEVITVIYVSSELDSLGPAEVTQLVQSLVALKAEPLFKNVRLIVGPFPAPN
eukprot:SM000051S17598  [mRNA]  locus=s51:756432:758539:+ [translate_table: standard]